MEWASENKEDFPGKVDALLNSEEFIIWLQTAEVDDS
jgi:hypothetical protein